MPNTKSAKKRLRQNVTRQARNRSAKSRIRSQIRKVREAVAAGETEKAEAEYRVAAQLLDRGSAKNVLHSNTASRLKSRLQRLIKSSKQAA